MKGGYFIPQNCSRLDQAAGIIIGGGIRVQKVIVVVADLEWPRGG